MAFRLPRISPADLVRTRPPSVDAAVEVIVRRVGDEGNLALGHYARAFGDPAPREIAFAEMRAALDGLPAQLREALTRTHERIARYARAQRDALREFSYIGDGLVLGQRLVPLDSAGVYIPAGRHPLPSTALMTITPAKIAGVEAVVGCTPRADPVTLAACALAGTDRLFLCGGAQAVAALAYGTTLVPRVAKIVGPGNAYVAAAKRLVAGVCGTDAHAGPSEVAVIASRDADAATVARSLLAEAEHDPDARAYLLCDDALLAERVDAAIGAQLLALDTAKVACAALASSGAIVCDALEACAETANDLGIEHVELLGVAAACLAPRLAHFGALFVGVPAAFGDYGAGPNHTLPTNGSARFASGLSVYDFLLVRPTVTGVDPAPTLAADAALLARTEGLSAHHAALAPFVR